MVLTVGWRSGWREAGGAYQGGVKSGIPGLLRASPGSDPSCLALLMAPGDGGGPHEARSPGQLKDGLCSPLASHTSPFPTEAGLGSESFRLLDQWIEMVFKRKWIQHGLQMQIKKGIRAKRSRLAFYFWHLSNFRKS